MAESPSYLTVGEPPRRLAVLSGEGTGAPVVWLGGFRSDMRATKAEALAGWAAERGRAFVRFDYSGHGESDGAFADQTLSDWLTDVLAVVEHHCREKPVLVGSSMGGWLALLAARRLAGTPLAPAGLVLIAPAVDFTDALMWPELPEEARRAITEEGVWMRPSQYAPEPTPITRALIEDGRRHLMFGSDIRAGCPVHILQGMQDPDVPWRHALTLVEHLVGDPVILTLVKDGDHRLSAPDDIARLIAAVAAIGQ